jgi:hypothetical protein
MSGILYRLSSSLLNFIRQVLFIFTGPYILRKILRCFSVLNLFLQLGLIQYMTGAETEPKLPTVWSFEIIYSHGRDIPGMSLGMWTYFRIILSYCVTMRFHFLTGHGWKAAAYVMWRLVKEGLSSNTCRRSEQCSWNVSTVLLLFSFYLTYKMRGILWHESNTNPVTRRSYKHNVARIL